VTYPKNPFSAITGCFLIKSLQTTICAAYNGSQTPYPQKHQQTLGATCPQAEHTVENRLKGAYLKALNDQ
jgi:hypothetical protein